MTAGGRSRVGKPMAATFGRPGVGRGPDGQVDAAHLQDRRPQDVGGPAFDSPAFAGMTIVAAGRPWSTKTKAREQGLSWTGRCPFGTVAHEAAAAARASTTERPAAVSARAGRRTIITRNLDESERAVNYRL